MIPELERVVDPAYVVGVAEAPIERIRAMRAECAELENGTSYVRRLAQGRLDLLAEETRRRSEGGGGNLGELVAGLADLMSERVRSSVSGRVDPQLEPPDHVVDPLCTVLDAVVGAPIVSAVAELTDTELADALDGIQHFEVELSHIRRSLHSVIDSLNNELARRISASDSPAGPS